MLGPADCFKIASVSSPSMLIMMPVHVLYVSSPSMFRMCPRKAHVDPPQLPSTSVYWLLAL